MTHRSGPAIRIARPALCRDLPACQPSPALRDDDERLGRGLELHRRLRGTTFKPLASYSGLQLTPSATVPTALSARASVDLLIS
jgi:hypothetical protein